MRESGQLTGLRNDRKPGHFWIDNEVADCYQSIVGADAIWVYCRIARYANGAWIVSRRLRGASDTRVGLREMADWCGKSVDTVWRCLQVLDLVGLLKSECAAKSAGRYALVDVKDLVLREGGEYDRDAGCFQLPAAKTAELKAQVKELRAKLARKKPAKTVAQSDSLTGADIAVADEKCDRSVAPEAQICTSGATAINCIEKSNTARLETTPPTPSPAGKGVQSLARDYADKRLAEIAFAGAHDALKRHLLNDRPKGSRPDLANGFDDWQRYAFSDLALCGWTRDGPLRVIRVSSTDAAATIQGLEKYRKTWAKALVAFYGAGVLTEVVERERST